LLKYEFDFEISS